MILAAIAACDECGLIGLDGALPWRLPTDLRRFRALTMGRPVIMGRATWESLTQPLAGRECVVVTSRPSIDGALGVPSLAAALESVHGVREAFVIGGAALFAEALPHCHRLHLTRVRATVPVPVGSRAVYLPRGGWWDSEGVFVERCEADTLPWDAYVIERPRGVL